MDHTTYQVEVGQS